MKSNLKYEKIKQDFYQQIQNRELLPNEKLASEAEYAEHYNVSTITIRKALSDLASEGYIRRIKGKGSFVESPSGFLTLVNRILWQKPHNCGFFYVKFIKF